MQSNDLATLFLFCGGSINLVKFIYHEQSVKSKSKSRPQITDCHYLATDDELANNLLFTLTEIGEKTLANGIATAMLNDNVRLQSILANLSLKNAETIIFHACYVCLETLITICQFIGNSDAIYNILISLDSFQNLSDIDNIRQVLTNRLGELRPEQQAPLPPPPPLNNYYDNQSATLFSAAAQHQACAAPHQLDDTDSTQLVLSPDLETPDFDEWIDIQRKP